MTTLSDRPHAVGPLSDEPPAREVQVLILGAGVCGIAAAIGLRKAGFDDVLIVERSDRLGGTWHHNRYPGCAVDIPTHLYSFSYAPNPEWSRVFATQPEIAAYLERVARDHGVVDDIALDTELLDAIWDDDAQRWRVTTSAGPVLARALVLAAGPLHEATTPSFRGLDTFAGTAFHSSAWPPDLDLAGRRVVAIGTGASAIQFLPAIQPHVERLTVLQRTPSWVMPKPDWAISATEKAALRRWPLLMRLLRWACWAPMDAGMALTTQHPRIARMTSVIGRLHMRRWIKDPATRRALTPDYAVTCKRVGLSNDYYRALAQPNVELVASAAAEVRPEGVLTADGRLLPCDTIIYGTGFRTLPHHPVNARVRGLDGRTLAEVWNGAPKAYLGTTMPGFPNAFIMFGPNIGTLSGFTMAEAQTDYLTAALSHLRDRGLASLDVTQAAQDAFVQEVDARLAGSTFLAGGCTSYYLDDSGRAALVWPWSMARMRRRLARFDPEAYEARLPSEVPAQV